MANHLHITSGDSAGDKLTKSGLPGEVFVWHDILYDGPRNSGWPNENTLNARALFLEQVTAGGLMKQQILDTLRNQYLKLANAAAYERIVLWFDACLFDQSMLAHILACLVHQGIREVELLCIDAFPGIVPFNGLGQMQPDQLVSVYDDRRPVTDTQLQYSVLVDKAFATQSPALLTDLSQQTDAPLPWIPAAATRWLQERPNPTTGLGRLEGLALDAVRKGCETPAEIYSSVAASDPPPQYWGDTTLWAKINAMANREPPLLWIEGPAERLPQWVSTMKLNSFRVRSSPADARNRPGNK